MTRWFGTDGIRARFGEEPLTESSVARLGYALARHLGKAPQPILVARDPRTSGPLLVEWLTWGIGAAGGEVLDLGVLPTAALARLVASREAPSGIVVSASHNPPEDNGIKLFDSAGRKWDPDREAALESLWLSTSSPAPGRSAARGEEPGALAAYLEAIAAFFPSGCLAGLRVALDCAHGAASLPAPELFDRLGAEVTAHFATPDGDKINVGCGSTHPATLAGLMAAGSFDLGFAFDGDADRALLFGPGGELHDGDAMLYLWALDLARRGSLEPRRVVSTTLANRGLELALARHGIELLRSGVGDREVARLLSACGLRLGGEPSGHLLDLHLATTGDGLLTAVQLAGIVVRSQAPLVDLLQDLRRFPQRQLKVAVARKPALESLPGYAGVLRDSALRLGEEGRILVRYSGTEPVVRILVEGEREPDVEAVGVALANYLATHLGSREAPLPAS